MALSTVMAAVKARLDETWTRCPVVYPNTKGNTPKDGSRYLAVSYPLASSQPITVGSPGSTLYRETGTFRLVLHVERGVGVDEGAAWMDELAAHFRGLTVGHFRCYGPTSPAHDDRNDLGNYYALSISVPYQADSVG
ncbi:DUF4128 domain-containing protein [Methylobacterium nodulans]|uniref:Tail terminator n=1 Tax=Methylobacterium nodulans (strain LMG 21967 / CNCM I-2342 / ORS 2060) TaxID=460265 RepID=B8IIM9_METNO|nr:DUF4128 domain-containing protein [Methylobacterium nodulans]ACL59906.1 hypothetical protein Mnod_5060 [Methylobacterium nodulans ORS 2060]